MKLPVVAIAGHRTIEGVTNVVLDQRRAAELALRHLYQLGHRKIAFMRGGSHSSDADDRWECLMAVAQGSEAGRAAGTLTVQLKLRVSTPELGYGPAEELLDCGADFTALVCYNDIAAIGAIRAFVDRGLRVPGDISVVGFDDIQGALVQQSQPDYNPPAAASDGHGCGAHPAAANSRPGRVSRFGANYS